MRWVLLASERAPASPTSTASPLARASPFTTDIQRIEGICAVGAVFEEVFFALGKFFAAFVLAETVLAVAHVGCMNGSED